MANSSGHTRSNAPVRATISMIARPNRQYPWTNGQVERMNRTIAALNVEEHTSSSPPHL